MWNTRFLHKIYHSILISSNYFYVSIIQPYLPYHQAAIIGTALDTVTLPMRRKNSPKISMSEMERTLVLAGCKAVGISCAIPIADQGILNGEEIINLIMIIFYIFISYIFSGLFGFIKIVFDKRDCRIDSRC